MPSKTPFEKIVNSLPFKDMSATADLTFHDASDADYAHRTIMVGDLFDSGDTYIKLFQAYNTSGSIEHINFPLTEMQVRQLRDYLNVVLESGRG